MFFLATIQDHNWRNVLVFLRHSESYFHFSDRVCQTCAPALTDGDACGYMRSTEKGEITGQDTS